MKNLRGRGVLLAVSAVLLLAPGARSLAVESNDPTHPSLSFVRLNVSDMPKMVAFYEKAFGMTEQRRMANGGNLEVILTTPGGLDLALHLRLSPAGRPRRRPGGRSRFPRRRHPG